MLIYIKSPQASIPEWALVELQGAIQSQPSCNIAAKEIVGNLHYSKKNLQPILILGHHVLVGKDIKLEQPMAVIEKNVMNENTEYLVKAIVKRKLLFKSRPKPIISNIGFQV